MKAGEVMTILDNALRIGKGVTRYGKVAAYIPELAKKDKNKLGICPLMVTGLKLEIQKTDLRFSRLPRLWHYVWRWKRLEQDSCLIM